MILLLGVVFGTSKVVPAMAACPRVGNGAVGLTFQALVPEVEAGHEGAVVASVAAYADSSTPVGLNVAHLLWRLVKSGAIGVGVPCRVNLLDD